MIQKTSIRRALVMSVALHAVGAIAWWTMVPTSAREGEVVDIELAPPAPAPEALPPEVARREDKPLANQEREDEAASTPPSAPGEGADAIDAGVDAAIDARPDAAIDARPDAAIDARPDARPDAAIDAAPDAPDTAIAAADDAGLDASSDALTLAAADDAGLDASSDALAIASADDAGSDTDAEVTAASTTDAGDDAAQVAVVELIDAGPRGEVAPSGAEPGAGSGADLPAGPLDTGALAAALAAESGVPGATNEPAVEGAPTTAGTAANLLSYFPDGHVVTALIRFDRLRGTEWAAQTERLLRPMPDHRLLFGARAANLTDKLETLVISSPRPRDAAATTLVGRTSLPRGALRDFLGQGAPVTWSTSKGGLLGKRGGKLFPNDRRVFLSPFRGWFLLAQPDDLGGLTAAAKGNPDSVEATGKLPAWLAGIRKIESESGDPRGPALVVTVALSGKRVALGGNDFGLGIASVPLPERASLAMELVPQGWLMRGNLRFASEADAAELVASVQRVQQRIADSRTIQLVIGKPIARVVANLAFARNGLRVSYATSVSIADARAILAAAAQQLDSYYGRPP